jgi:acetyltransferase-like isoleucine patch superfamily enzyme
MILISPLAHVSPDARLGDGVRIGPFTVVHDGVILADGCVVESHCQLGHPAAGGPGGPLFIGPGAIIRSHSVFYRGSHIAEGLRTGHHVTVREGVVAGPGLQLGTGADLQGRTSIGRHVRTHSGVFVAQGTRIGDFVWLFPGARLLDDHHPPSDVAREGAAVEDYAVIGAGASVLAGVRVGSRSLVAAGSVVNRDVAPDSVVAGVPARARGSTSKILLRDGSGRPAYPWMRHFHRGYPAEDVARWEKEFGSP